MQDNLEIQQNKTKLTINQASTKFPESNLMHQMNGFIACNGPTLQLPAGSRVRWIVLGFGSEVDMHSPVFEGQAVEYAGARLLIKGGGEWGWRESWKPRLRGGDGETPMSSMSLGVANYVPSALFGAPCVRR